MAFSKKTATESICIRNLPDIAFNPDGSTAGLLER